MALTTLDRQEIIKQYAQHEGDTGSAEVQVALLTGRITYLTAHFKTHTKDHASRRGLLKLVGRRRRLLKYIKTHDVAKYQATIEALGLRR